MTHITITGRSGDNANIAAVLRGYVERFELTSPMVKQMMLDAADALDAKDAEIERLNEDREKYFLDNLALRAEIEWLQRANDALYDMMLGMKINLTKILEGRTLEPKP